MHLFSGKLLNSEDFYGGKLTDMQRNRFKTTLKIAADVKPTDLAPITYENLVSMPSMTTAIIAPHSENGKRFWASVTDKNRGFSLTN